MLVFEKIEPLQDCLTSHPSIQKIGFIPTMGALHNGHLSLISQSKQEGNFTVCSIYVNPRQFDDSADWEKYPRTIEDDIEKLKTVHCDVLFCPHDHAIYPDRPLTYLDFGYLESIMEGKYREGHFKGVGLVVSKLFNIVKPHVAYFGQKDYQQFLIIRQLVKDLAFGIELVCMPTLRETDGLAMSSRNKRLKPEERSVASSFYKALTLAKKNLLMGKPVEEVKELVIDFCSAIKEIQLEYFVIANSNTLKAIEDSSNNKEMVLCIAGYVGNVRLIDNIIVRIS